MYDIKYMIFFILILIDYVQTDIRKLPFNTIVTFGDSNTDIGNVYNLTNSQWPLVPPYYQGRFSNGPLWIERLNIPNILNYAHGDATIDDDNFLQGFTGPNKTKVPGIRQQIIAYLATHDIATVDLSRTLYVVWANGNEYFINSSLSSDIVVKSFLKTVYDLLVVGIKNLIIINLPPIHLHPGIDKNKIFQTLITQHNYHLTSNLTRIKLNYKKTSIKIFDLYSLMINIISNNSLNLLNTIDKCWNLVNNNIISQCTNPDQFVFIDDYHYTSVIHQVIADNIEQFIISLSNLRTSFSKFCIFMSIIIFLI